VENSQPRRVRKDGLVSGSTLLTNCTYSLCGRDEIFGSDVFKFRGLQSLRKKYKNRTKGKNNKERITEGMKKPRKKRTYDGKRNKKYIFVMNFLLRCQLGHCAQCSASRHTMHEIRSN
jgi:hypothetical protein